MTDRMRDPAVSIALLRLAVGVSFAKALVTKLSVVPVGGFAALPETSARWLAAVPHIVGKQALANPLLLDKQFLNDVVLPHATLFCASDRAG